MTKPAAHDAVVRVRSEPTVAVADPASQPRVPVRPAALAGLARPEPERPVAAGRATEQQDPGTAVARLRRQADRHGAPGSPAAADLSGAGPTRMLDELHRRGGTVAPPRPPAGRLVVRRQVVTQLRLGGERSDQVTGVAIVGRPPNTFGSSMGDHTTAFTVHVNAVQQALHGAPLAEAADRLGVLVSELRSLPGYALVGETLPPRHLGLWQAALATITEVRRRIGERSGDLAGLIQQYVGAYLELRELVPLSTVDTSTVSKATSGKGKGEAVDALRDQAAGRAQKPEVLAGEVLGLFDVRAAALACAETDPVRLAALAPGLPAGLGPRERGRLIVLQHLRSIQTGYPGALAALGGEAIGEVAGSSGDSAAKLAAARRKAAQDADDKVLGRLIEEILSNHVLPRMVTAVLAELDSLQADHARDALALMGYEHAGGDRALNSGKTGKKADLEKARITAQLALTRARIKELDGVLSNDSVFGAKSGGSTGIAKAKPLPEAGSGSGDKAAPSPGVQAGGESGGRPKRKREAPVDPLEVGRKREQQQRHERALQKVSKKSGRRAAPASSGEAEEHGGKRAKVGAPGTTERQVRDEIAQLAAQPVFSGSDPMPEAEAIAVEAPAPPARQTVQVLLDEAGVVAEIRAAGRPPSPFPHAVGMGAHTTAWTVHLDRVRAALVGKDVAAATAELEGPLRREREASAAALGRVFEFRRPVPAASRVADGAATLTRLQDQIVSHLEQVNLLPGATLPGTDTGGKGEGRHRRVLQDARRCPPRVVYAAVLGMLDLGSLADGTASTELRVADGAPQVLIGQHLAAIAAAYPAALPRAGIDPRSSAHLAAILATVEERERAEDSGRVASRRPAAEDDEEAAEEPGRSVPSGRAPLTLDDALFGKHQPPGAPSVAAGRPESAPASLLGSAGALVLPSEADRAAAALWLDPAGNLIEDRLDQFTAAYTDDLAEAGTYLAEGEGTVAARHFRVSVRVYRDTAPPEFEARRNPGGGDCLLYALNHVAQAAARQPLSDLSGEAITTARAAIVAGLPAEAARNAARAIVTDAVDQRHVAGLGTRLAALLNNPGFRHAAAWVRTGRQREAAEALLKAKSEPAKPPAPKKEPVAPRPADPAIRHQAVYGDGGPLPDQALLHTGGNHYVALIRRPALSLPPGSSPRPPTDGLPVLTTLSAPARLHLPVSPPGSDG